MISSPGRQKGGEIAQRAAFSWASAEVSEQVAEPMLYTPKLSLIS